MNKWAIEKLNGNKTPEKLFLDICKNLADTPESKELLKALSQKVTLALPVVQKVKLAEVEHPETVNQPVEKDVTCLAFRIYVRKDYSINFVIAPPNETEKPYKAKFWKDFSFIIFGNLKLFGPDNTSIWENDDYLVDGIKDKKFQDKLLDLPYCVIENTPYQSVVCDEEYKKFSLVTGILHTDFTKSLKEKPGHENMELGKIEPQSVGDIFVRLACSAAFEVSSKNSLKKSFALKALKLPVKGIADLKSCDLHKLDPELPVNVPKDTLVLDLSMNNLTAVPEWIRNLKKLEELNLYANEITVIPEWVSELKLLKKLELTSNPVKKIPESIGLLKNLERLDCVGAELNALPKSITSLAALTRLDLRQNRIKKLPADIGNLKNLIFLDLSNNALESLPSSFSKLTMLERLELKKNPIDFPQVVVGMTKLKKLFISSAKVTKIPAGIKNMKSLISLSLTGNEIRIIPDELGECRKLEFLDMNENKIVSIPESLLHLSKLEYLDLSDNQIESLPDFSNCKKLKTFYLGANKINLLPDPFVIPNSINELSLRDNQITSISLSAVDPAKHSRINLQNNPLTEECLLRLKNAESKVKI